MTEQEVRQVRGHLCAALADWLRDAVGCVPDIDEEGRVSGCDAMHPTPIRFCPMCGADLSGRIRTEVRGDGEWPLVHMWVDLGDAHRQYTDAADAAAHASASGFAVMDDHLRRRMFNPITFEPGSRIRDLWTNEVFEVAKHDSHTGMTELTAVGNGLVHLANSNNNARYVAVREEA